MSDTTEQLFRTPQEALVYAFNYSMQRQDRTLADRLAAPSPRTGKGLSGNDGAGQSGMIRRELAQLAALYAPRSWPCACRSPCCSGEKENPEYAAAILFLDQVAMSVLSGRIVHFHLRRGLVEKAVFALRKEKGNSLPKIELKTLALRCGVSEGTADAHWKLIKAWFLGQPKPKTVKSSKRRRVAAGDSVADVADESGDGESEVAAVDGIASMACKRADELLSALPFIRV